MNHLTVNNKFNKPWWVHPWGFKENVVIAGGLFLVGCIVEILGNGFKIHHVRAPFNIYIGFLFLAVLVFIHINFRKSEFGKWLSGLTAIITAILLLAGILLLMIFIPQEEKSSRILSLTGISHLRTSFIFLLAIIFFLSSLGMVIMRRLYPFSRENISFFLFHFGLFLTVLTLFLGAGDIKRGTINLLEEGEESNAAIAENEEIIELPFSVRLIDFSMEEFNPRLILKNINTGKITGDENNYPMIEPGLKTTISDWKIKIEKFLPNAIVRDSLVSSSVEDGNCQAAQFKAIKDNDTIQGWLTTGSYLQEPLSLMLDSINQLFLASPEPRNISSVLVLRMDTLQADTVILSVNKPVSAGSWKIFQKDYDHSKGRWSSLSILEAVNDPWSPLVYAGLLLVAAGALLSSGQKLWLIFLKN